MENNIATLKERQDALIEQLNLIQDKLNMAESTSEKDKLSTEANSLINSINKIDSELKDALKEQEKIFEKKLELSGNSNEPFKKENGKENVLKKIESGNYDLSNGIPTMKQDEFDEMYFDLRYNKLTLLADDYYKKRYGYSEVFIEIRPVTIADEEYVVSSTVGNVMDNLINAVCKFPNIKYGELLVTDKIFIFLSIRISMDNEYTFELNDPKTREKFRHTVDLSSLETIDGTGGYDDNGILTAHLPVSKKTVSFIVPNVDNFDAARERVENIKKEIREYEQRGEEVPLRLTLMCSSEVQLFISSIKLIDGQQISRGDAMKFAVNMNRKDYKHYKEVMNNSIDMINMSVNIEAPSGERFRSAIGITRELVFPS